MPLLDFMSAHAGRIFLPNAPEKCPVAKASCTWERLPACRRVSLLPAGLVHNCPVYGGSSGSPLLRADTGELVGIHSAFDFNRFEAQAVTLEALQVFLQKYLK